MPHRRLPHIYPEGATLFITFCLHGATQHLQLPPSGTLKSGEAFVRLDRQLDAAMQGPVYLRDSIVAELIVNSIRKGVELRHYQLHAYVLMANHVHLLITPMIPADRLLKSLTGASAREANLLLGRTGEPFWQKESYDHFVRNQQEFEKIRAYIENNPVKAGLVRAPEEFRWSSAAIDTLTASAM